MLQHTYAWVKSNTPSTCQDVPVVKCIRVSFTHLKSFLFGRQHLLTWQAEGHAVAPTLLCISDF